MDSTATVCRDGGGDGVLLVIAHPDDESMFFAPTLLALAPVLRMHVLCMSTGNYDGLGSIRSIELPRACVHLGVDTAHVAVIDDPELQDGPRDDWPAERVADLVSEHMRRHRLQRVITFDRLGISHHANHIAVQRGVRLVAARAGTSNDDQAIIVVYELHSTSLLRRNLGVWDVLPSLLAVEWQRRDATAANSSAAAPSVCFVNLRPWRCHWAMREHASQYVWFRRLYVLLSRYVFVNTLSRVAAKDG